jgi:hypothetical protein
LNRGRRARQGLGMGRTRASLNSDDACERVPEYEFRFWRFPHARPASGLLVVYRDAQGRTRYGPDLLEQKHMIFRIVFEIAQMEPVPVTRDRGSSFYGLHKRHVIQAL